MSFHRVRRSTAPSKAVIPADRAGPAPMVVQDVLATPGSPLPADLCAEFGPRFGFDFSQVRVHTDDLAARSSESVSAEAFTVGRHIVFGASRFSPATTRGRELLSHELAHVVQHRGASGTGTPMVGAPDCAAERQADSGGALSVAAPMVRRKPARQDTAAAPEITVEQSPEQLVIRVAGEPAARVIFTGKNPAHDVNVLAGDDKHIRIELRHDGGARLEPDLRFLRERSWYHLDLREFNESDRVSASARETDEEPRLSPADNARSVPVTVVDPPPGWRPGSSSRSQGEKEGNEETGDATLSEFEYLLREQPGLINGVVLDPESREPIGYRQHATTGVSRFLDRAGNAVDMAEKGLEAPVADPIDLLPTPGGAVKAGAGVVGKIGAKAVTKKPAAAGIILSYRALLKMRWMHRALLKKASRKVLQESAGLVRRITPEALDHSFSKHAADWFGRQVSKTTHMTQWRALIEQGMRSTVLVPWVLKGPKEALVHLARVEGRYFAVCFSPVSGELITAFLVEGRTLPQMLKLATRVR
ncbi:DUF4157 domain-containing protein [Allokutzneria sp. A3M-2-11 16]|uniref:eCIS core domain-containing protein n=1 Tax=Allokutzneria sp. A3M-2-11 16 TaxID=2962043 RepID=UPI0020B6E1B1|nr:DUF4157 domain-containing protein [Allokutzneria sp. A3M-2-11 16]MCP3799899.1 DUF4157 domain-containing protein [Allokutzneria sp. A3M-2-11 16]